LRVLIEPAEEPGDARANLEPIEAALAPVSCPRLLHGLGASAWEFVRLAAERAYDTRTGFEDTLTLPDGSLAESNATLVAAARRIIAKAVSP
jgi:beta-keto acid cleavage enzyme